MARFLLGRYQYDDIYGQIVDTILIIPSEGTRLTVVVARLPRATKFRRHPEIVSRGSTCSN